MPAKEAKTLGKWECPHPDCRAGDPPYAEYQDPVEYGITECDKGHVVLLLSVTDDGTMQVRLEGA